MTQTIKNGGVTFTFKTNAHPSNVKVNGSSVIHTPSVGATPEVYQNARTGAPSQELEGTSCIGIYVLENN